MAAAAAPTGAASAEQQAGRDALQRQIADLQRQSGELQQQVAQRSHDLAQSSHDLDAARSESKKLRQDIEALEQFRKTAEQQIDRFGAAARDHAWSIRRGRGGTTGGAGCTAASKCRSAATGGATLA